MGFFIGMQQLISDNLTEIIRDIFVKYFLIDRMVTSMTICFGSG